MFIIVYFIIFKWNIELHCTSNIHIWTSAIHIFIQGYIARLFSIEINKKYLLLYNNMHWCIIQWLFHLRIIYHLIYVIFYILMYYTIIILPPYPLPYPPADTPAIKVMVATTTRVIFILLLKLLKEIYFQLYILLSHPCE